MLKAMQAELDREKALLVLPGMQRPYFIEYQVDDLNSYEAVATYGALAREEANHQRVARVTVRVGDYAVDSSSSRGDGAVALAPSDDNAEALRYANAAGARTVTVKGPMEGTSGFATLDNFIAATGVRA